MENKHLPGAGKGVSLSFLTIGGTISSGRRSLSAYNDTFTFIYKYICIYMYNVPANTHASICENKEK
jgi:hypothetical protein